MDVSETIVVYDIKVGRCCQLNEYTNLWNIKGQGHSMTFAEGHLDATFSNFLSFETARQIEAAFYVESPWDEGMKVNANGLCHMTKMAVMLIYGKNLLKIFFSGANRLMTLKTGLWHWLLEY